MNKLRWFTFWWWKYLSESESWTNLICRIKGHPNGIIFYANCLATEPDGHCKDCGEEIGA